MAFETPAFKWQDIEQDPKYQGLPDTMKVNVKRKFFERYGHDFVADVAKETGVDPHLALATYHIESGGQPEGGARAKSKAGAIGPMQLMPATAKDLGVDPHDPLENARGGVRYLSQMLKRFNDPDLAMAAYNAGPGAVQKALKAGGQSWQSFLPEETRTYISRARQFLSQGYPAEQAGVAAREIPPVAPVLAGDIPAAGPLPVTMRLGGRGLQPEPESLYVTQLTPEEEEQFQTDVQVGKLGPYAPETVQRGPETDYDLRGFWRARRQGDPRATTAVNPNDREVHFPDRWKTPQHKTFSRQSIYATPDAPDWNEHDQLVDPTGKILFDERAQAAGEPVGPPLPPLMMSRNAMLGSAIGGALPPEVPTGRTGAVVGGFGGVPADVQSSEEQETRGLLGSQNIDQLARALGVVAQTPELATRMPSGTPREYLERLSTAATPFLLPGGATTGVPRVLEAEARAPAEALPWEVGIAPVAEEAPWVTKAPAGEDLGFAGYTERPTQGPRGVDEPSSTFWNRYRQRYTPVREQLAEHEEPLLPEPIRLNIPEPAEEVSAAVVQPPESTPSSPTVEERPPWVPEPQPQPEGPPPPTPAEPAAPPQTVPHEPWQAALAGEPAQGPVPNLNEPLSFLENTEPLPFTLPPEPVRPPPVVAPQAQPSPFYQALSAGAPEVAQRLQPHLERLTGGDLSRVTPELTEQTLDLLGAKAATGGVAREYDDWLAQERGQAETTVRTLEDYLKPSRRKEPGWADKQGQRVAQLEQMLDNSRRYLLPEAPEEQRALYKRIANALDRYQGHEPRFKEGPAARLEPEVLFGLPKEEFIGRLSHDDTKTADLQRLLSWALTPGNESALERLRAYFISTFEPGTKGAMKPVDQLRRLETRLTKTGDDTAALGWATDTRAAMKQWREQRRIERRGPKSGANKAQAGKPAGQEEEPVGATGEGDLEPLLGGETVPLEDISKDDLDRILRVEGYGLDPEEMMLERERLEEALGIRKK